LYTDSSIIAAVEGIDRLCEMGDATQDAQTRIIIAGIQTHLLVIEGEARRLKRENDEIRRLLEVSAEATAHKSSGPSRPQAGRDEWRQRMRVVSEFYQRAVRPPEQIRRAA
jgi:hypothetical protein